MLQMLEAYGGLKETLPIFRTSYNRCDVRKYLSMLVNTIKLDSSPGVPLSLLGNTNSQVISILGDEFLDMVCNRVENLLTYDFQTPEQSLEQGLCDPVRVFVKNEPHKISKLQEGRPRLIMSVSLVDKMIEKLIDFHINKHEIANWRTMSYKPGMGFTPEMNLDIFDSFNNLGLNNFAEADIKGWDWSVKDWMKSFDVEFRLRCQTQTHPWYHRLARQRSSCYTNSVLQLSDGSLIIHPPGLILSGSENTSSTNSKIRDMTIKLVLLDDQFYRPAVKQVATMGDDSIEPYVPNAIEKYRRLGLVCKMYKRLTNSFEFCSHIYTPKGAYAINIIKETMNLLNHTVCDSDKRLLISQFEYELAFNPDFPKLLEVLNGMGWYANI